MRQTPERRKFLKTGAIAAAGSVAAGWFHRAAAADRDAATSRAEHHEPTDAAEEYDGFSRYRPTRGNDPDSDYYLGKLVPGFRSAADGPAPFIAPDLDKLPWKLVDGAKEFHLVPQAVSREFLPGYAMRVYGFNGSMPGPTIEVTQGDRVRIVVHNDLPEATFIHWHGFELPIQFDGAAELTQNPIEPGGEFVYEFEVHEEGTFFYHSHVPMQEAFGMVGWFIVHPRKVWDPPVDRDFGIIFQNFHIEPTQTISDSWAMDWSWHTMNGRSGPFATPMVVKHGERVRIRIMDFSPMQHHPIHIHGHTFWVTGHEGARAPKSAWVPRNTELIAIAQASEFEFIANNPGDWMFHCHMVHHMMNHMVRQVGPRVRNDVSVDAYLANLNNPPRATLPLEAGFGTPGYPQKMQGMEMSPEFMQRIWSRREVQGMRATWPMAVMGLMTAVRVLPEDLYRQVIESDEPIEKEAVFAEIVRRFGDPSVYQPAMQMPMDHGMRNRS